MLFCVLLKPGRNFYVQYAQIFWAEIAIFTLAQGHPGCYNMPKGGAEMRDFPVFPTDCGVSSLILREIPYRAEAYIHIQAGNTPVSCKYRKIFHNDHSFCAIIALYIPVCKCVYSKSCPYFLCIVHILKPFRLRQKGEYHPIFMKMLLNTGNTT